ncbi:S8 family serine peptidase [Luteolibacter sp. SL250]|uniref:S8 family peptidase n=1 Tax=Luteolibacter sp. SL250 TaxID=2995170 RepID=UPI002271392C|nr:S8 family serine peptidase [Luteolibacter sp. SL250]WAC18271.1 S8 family serine peptidase [Luteolibacter sp. SL250]
MRWRPLIFVTGFLLTAVGGYLIARTAIPPKKDAEAAGSGKSSRPRQPHEMINPDPEFRKRTRPAFQADREAQEAGALVGQRTLVFANRAAMEAFLARAAGKVNVMGRLDRLSVLRIGFLNYEDLAALLDGSEEIGLIFSATFPESESVSAQPGAVPMGSALLEWLGISGDHSSWGQGVRIAVLDTGVSPHPAFGGQVIPIGQAGDPNGHGTAVASMILGNTLQLPGVAPGSTVISLQVADEHGYSDSFRIAEGILAAMDAGAVIINISLGSTGDSALLRSVVAMARDAGVLIVAPTGNSGSNQVLMPAAYDGVIAVGAVDKAGQVLAFSNTGMGIDLVAPGYGLNAAWTEDGAAAVSGTSFSGPIVAGMIAGVMQQMGVTNLQAWDIILKNLDETGQPGYDQITGNGTPNAERILASGTPGIHDAAFASYWVDPAKPDQMQVTIQNRGTEPLVNTAVTVKGPSGIRYFNSTSLKVGGIQTFSVPMGRIRGGSADFETTVTVSGGQQDLRPGNNVRVETHTPSQGW